MGNKGSKAVTKFRSVMRTVMVARIGLLLALSNGVPGWAATVFDVNKIMAAAPKVAGPANLLLLQSEQTIYHVRLDYLRTLVEARKRIGGISSATSSLALVIESKPSASALRLAGRNVILVSTGMLELVGPDSGMAAALLGNVYGHLYMKNSLGMASNLPHLVNDAVALGNNVGRQIRNRRAAADNATACGLMGTSFIAGAKKFFADSIIGFRG